jgi:hypothetical protein
MALPKIDVPIYELKLPSSGKTIKVRPFLVKEEKLLLMAVQSKNETEIIETTKQIINNCLLDDGVNVEKLPFFDIDYLFIALRAKSIGEYIDVNFICNRMVEGTKCGHVFPVKIDINNVKVYKDEKVSMTIKLTDNIGAKMKYPSYEVMKRIIDAEDNLTKKIKLIAASIDVVYNGDQTYSTKDSTPEEFQEFIEGFTDNQFKKLESFVDNLPYFVVTAEETCKKCGHHHKIEYKDFTSFFL